MAMVMVIQSDYHNFYNNYY